MSIATLSRAAEAWEKTTWNGEPAWAATATGVRAVVTEARARLIYLGAADGSLNLLNAPTPAVAPAAANHSPNWGGHRFWLGPQYRWVWPPPADWEHRAATTVEARGAVLVVHQPQTDPAYPALVREYAWEGSRLRCTARWTGDGRPYFGLHVVAVNVPFTITTRLLKWDEAPLGLVSVRMVGVPAPLQLPHPAIAIEGDRATVRAGLRVAKLGFVPQSLEIARPSGWRLAMQPGPHTGIAFDTPDHGYLSQVWVGGAEADLAELEQLTPFLVGDAAGACSSTIFLEATPPPASVAR